MLYSGSSADADASTRIACRTATPRPRTPVRPALTSCRAAPSTYTATLLECSGPHDCCACSSTPRTRTLHSSPPRGRGAAGLLRVQLDPAHAEVDKHQHDRRDEEHGGRSRRYVQVVGAVAEGVLVDVELRHQRAGAGATGAIRDDVH